MLKNLIILPDGTELTSGHGQTNNIRSLTLTEMVNSGEELTMGSACASMLEVTVQTPRGGLSLTAGDEVTLYKVAEDGTRHPAGIFALEKPTRTSANMLRLIGYDHVAELDKDLTAWLKNLKGWPYDLLTFAGMVCEACGLKLVTKSIPNGDYPVQKFQKEATGRQLMRWIGEICCRFCRATVSGDIELAWYTKTDVSIAPYGTRCFFQRSLSYEDYQVAPIEAVQVKLTDGEAGALIPTVPDGTNSYIISGNPIFTSVTDAALSAILAELSWLRYTPCKVAVLASTDIHAGDIVTVTDSNGTTISACVMCKRQRGQRDTLECTGSHRRDSSTAGNNKTLGQQAADLENRALEAGKEAVKNQTPEEVFNALTNNGEIQGFYLKDGKVYINGEFAKIVNLVADSIVSGRLASADGLAYFDLDGSEIGVRAPYLFEEGAVSAMTLREGQLIGTITHNDGRIDSNFEIIMTNAGAAISNSMGGKPLQIVAYLAELRLGRIDSPCVIRGGPLTLVGSEIHIKGDPIYFGSKKLEWRTDPDAGFSYLVGVEVTT